MRVPRWGPSGSDSRAASSGQATLEFSLVFVIVFVLIFVLVDFGRVVYAQNAITEGTREGMRVAVIEPVPATPGDPLTGTDYQNKYQRIRDAALVLSAGVGFAAVDVAGDPPPDPLDPGACTEGITRDPTSSSTCFYPFGSAQGNQAVVNITVTVSPITPIVPLLRMLTGSGGSWDAVTLTARSVGTVQ